MDKRFESIKEEALSKINNAKSVKALNEARNEYFAKSGLIATLMSKIRELAPNERKDYGQAVNTLKVFLEEKLGAALREAQSNELSEKLESEKIDLTLPGRNLETAPQHPFHLVKDEICDIFIGMGYIIAEGDEVEEDLFNFTLLNMPENHPARDMQDTFYINEKLLLRTHTSPVQARVMQKNKNQPLKMISPGKVFRRDDDDNTHSHQFGQVEGLVIGEGISFSHLKATLDLFAKKMFGPKREIRLRSSYFPFTEPSVEVDVSCHVCNGKGCSTCKGTGWIEILGAGMVNPNVLTMNGYDTEKFTGFAFGVGIERVAMLRYGIDDIRRFYQNDIRFLKEFPKR